MAHQVFSQSVDAAPSQPLVEPKEITTNNDDGHTQVLHQRGPSLKRHQGHDVSDKNDTMSSSSNNTYEETVLQGSPSAAVLDVGKKTSTSELGLQEERNSGRERLKRHRSEVAGRVWIPDIWGQEELLKDWVDCSAFDASLVPTGIMSARAALVHEGRRANSGRLRIENRC
ncbi:hypothetical protein FNV43_RR15576 [Rhamnella rubrinervis]|uniref:Protein BIC1 n=1 Tax=Rhamnella rubrinervis TaxID=2594499 RepID=A0A8K0E7M6_9ROSA|nr:hypothetical protein FNV43_RR15576 [Rhamnella rubrinervis]